ncbi:hypothetical protein Ciccas_010371 [Cichlidogyrus casuarinus]|uniref:Uncharacterized protein n=1 Tax=Cichlidogyrus casuarinus TaxID=1844966 RepID=A0ABD2PX78_9PLAT
MPLVLQLPQGSFQFLILYTIVYWTIVAGHAASGFGFLVGILLLPLLIIQISLLCHVWSSISGKTFGTCSPVSSRSHSLSPDAQGNISSSKSRSSSSDSKNSITYDYMLISQFGDDVITSDLDA